MVKKPGKDGFLGKMTMDQCKDTGMATVLILLFFALLTKRHELIYWAMGVLLINMVKPKIYSPVAIVWFKLAELLGTITSRIILSVVFFIVVTPVGLLRRAMGKDSLKLKEFKKGYESVMEVRNKTFSASDIAKPY
jgi:hypothetical protein